MQPEGRPLRILIVDDDPALLDLACRVIEESGYGRPVRALTAAEGMSHAADADIILLDHQLPDTTGIELLPALRHLPTQPTVILVTGHGNEALAAQALRAGADDYLIKDGSLAGLLPQVLERARRQRALREALAAAERDLVHAERLAAIGQLHVTLHHTINNPLMAAMAETELLLVGRELTDDQRSGLTAVRQALLRISEILQRVGSLRHDNTTDYLEGISMIDLSRRTRPMPVSLGEAIVWLPDEDLARVVTMLLKHAGFTVTRVIGVTELASRASESGVAIVLVSASGAPGTSPLNGFHPATHRHYLVVALVAGDPTAARAAGADHVVQLPFDPGTFASDLLAAMRG